MGRVSQGGDDDDDEATKRGPKNELRGCLIVIRLPRPRGLSLDLGIGRRGRSISSSSQRKSTYVLQGILSSVFFVNLNPLVIQIFFRH